METCHFNNCRNIRCLFNISQYANNYPYMYASPIISHSYHNCISSFLLICLRFAVGHLEKYSWVQFVSRPQANEQLSGLHNFIMHYFPYHFISSYIIYMNLCFRRQTNMPNSSWSLSVRLYLVHYVLSHA